MEEGFGIVEEVGAGFTRVAVAGEVDVATAPALRTTLDQLIDRGDPVLVVDLLSVTCLDSTALGVLIAAQRRCEASATELRIVIKEPRLLKIFEITGLTDLFTIVDSVDRAVPE